MWSIPHCSRAVIAGCALSRIDSSLKTRPDFLIGSGDQGAFFDCRWRLRAQFPSLHAARLAVRSPWPAKQRRCTLREIKFRVLHAARLAVRSPWPAQQRQRTLREAKIPFFATDDTPYCLVGVPTHG